MGEIPRNCYLVVFNSTMGGLGILDCSQRPEEEDDVVFLLTKEDYHSMDVFCRRTHGFGCLNLDSKKAWLECHREWGSYRGFYGKEEQKAVLRRYSLNQIIV